VLLVESRRGGHWELPGGVVGADESPYQAAARELRQQLGLAVTPGRLLVVDWVPADVDRREAVFFVYAAGLVDPPQAPDVRLRAEQLRGWGWCDGNEWGERLSAALRRRVVAAVRAVEQGVSQYLEDGHPVG
jgi:8-oxo-dGTP pyrophosphatase MutT (NUDIX family)